ncbi:MAG: CheY-like chemotaxis protein [Parvibaculaceae bacterium]|jgi:CheY-like chemotaxis protein
MATADWTGLMKPYDLSHLSFLIADENIFTLSVMRKILNAFHAQRIFEAQSAHEAYAYFRLAPIDIIITDCLQEPADEIDFIRQIRNDEKSPNQNIPILMLTAHSDTLRLSAAREAGATEILTKPLTAQKLYTALQVMIEQSSQPLQAPPLLMATGTHPPSPHGARTQTSQSKI